MSDNLPRFTPGQHAQRRLASQRTADTLAVLRPHMDAKTLAVLRQALALVAISGRGSGGRIGRTREKLDRAGSRRTDVHSHQIATSLLRDLIASAHTLVRTGQNNASSAHLTPLCDALVDLLDGLVHLIGLGITPSPTHLETPDVE